MIIIYCCHLSRIFSNLSQDYYVGVTMQSIDRDWKLCNLPVAFAPITGPHTAEAVGTMIASLLTPFLGMF